MQSVTSQVKPIPAGYHSVTPIIMVDGAARLIEFLKQVFDAQEKERFAGPDGRLVHAEVRIGDSILMMADATKEFPVTPGMIQIYTDDVDSSYKRALAAGAVSLREPTNQFYGDRSAGVRDQMGNQWWISTHVEDVSPEELQKRMKARESQKETQTLSGM